MTHETHIEPKPAVGAGEAADEARLLTLVAALADELHGDDSPYPEVTLDTQFERDLGFDSLARAELLARIETAFGVQLPVETFASAATASDVLAAITGASARQPSSAASSPSAPLFRPSSLRVPAPPAGEPEVPTHAKSLVEALRWHADHHAERTHIVLIEEDGVTQSQITYGELHERAMQVASGMRKLGIDPGDTVALMMPTTFDYFVIFIATLLCGAVPAPIYPPVRIGQLAEHLSRHADLLANAEVKALVTFDKAAAVGHLLKVRVPSIRHVLTPESIEQLPPDRIVRAHADDLALLQYTSGSTGTPKGVMLTHANLLANIRAMGARINVTHDDVFVSWLPLSHNMGLIGAWLAPLYFGVPLVVTSPLTFLARPQSWLQMITHFRGTITAAPNFAYDRCAHHLPDAALEGLDLSSLRFASCGAEPVSVKTMRAFCERMGPVRFDPHAIAPVYGLAENVLALTLPPPGRGLQVDNVMRHALLDDGIASPSAGAGDAIEVVGCGSVLDGSELRIVDEQGRLLPERRVGRIEFRGAAATRGYYRNPAKTAQLMDGDWFDSGDLGYLANGTLYVTGRMKDMIIRGGQHFFPYELEEAIGQIPGVIAGGVAVCGSVDATHGTERVIVFAETAEEDPGVRASLVEQISRAAIASFGAPVERIVLVAAGSVPKTAAGKIRHAAMLERFEHAEHDGPAAAASIAPHAAWRQVTQAVAGSLKPFASRAFERLGAVAFGLWCWAMALSIALALWPRVAMSADEKRNWERAARAARLFLRVTGLSPNAIPDAAALPSAACIIAVNHLSYLDSVVLLACLPHPVHFVVKREMEHTPLIGRFLKALGVYFVERDDYRASLEDEQRLVTAAQRETLLFFPEGTFGRAAGLRPFHLGAFRAACLAGRPVFPIALRGTRNVLRDGDWLPVRSSVAMTVLTPIAPQGTDLRSMAQLRNEVRAAILGVCGEPELVASE